MTIELLNERMSTLDAQYQNAIQRFEKAKADMNAIDGARQEVLFWIKKIKEIDSKED